MSDSDSPTRGDLHHHPQQQLHQSLSPQRNAAAVDQRDDVNNSIIGKVKSRVSSILPQKVAQWFSPSPAASKTSNGKLGRRRRPNNTGQYERENNSDDGEDSNYSGEDEEDASSASTQPPTKRSRLNVEVTTTNFKGSQSLVSSTPTSGPRRRLTHLNLYGKQKESPYDFGQTRTTTNTMSRSFTTTKDSNIDSADIIDFVPDRNVLSTSLSSRRSLNIPSTSSTEIYRNLHNLKRQSVSNFRASVVGPSPYTSQRTSATILEVQDDEDDDDGEEDEEQHKLCSQTNVEEGEDDVDLEEEDDNEESEEIAKVTSKKRKFTNGNLVGRSSSVATESGESRSSSVAQAAAPKSGLFNPTNRGLRTLSGNGLNFYSHLEGRKSLFSEKNMPGMLNNSTLSLTSLNRRQFNSSIYGSTSALSDSRLLNTSSPFYKGQTTYGGAAAYSKFNRTLNQSVRIAPTLIRPTSSLSTLSLSTSSLAQGNDQSNSAISSTAKRILELINDFSTPLNDAKKMASNIKTPAMLANRTAAGKRFSEADLATSRSVRLSSVRSPYTRPSVTLNPNSNDSKKVLPSLKELQVPSMSQLLQMKKMQNCTERSRQIANTSKSTLNQECEYKLPGAGENARGDKNGNKHVSKIKNKVSTGSRISSKKVVVEDEEAPTPANLPNIAFPFMQSVPKIDISVNSTPAPTKQPAKTDFKFAVSADAKPTNNFSFGVASKPTEDKSSATPAPSKAAMTFNFGTSSCNSRPNATSSNEFKFSSPLSVSYAASTRDLAPINNFKFSSPVVVCGGQDEVAKEASPSTLFSSAVPQLKVGSGLDAIKKPVEKVSPTSTKAASLSAAPPTSLFGSQFKKTSNEWECSVCMIRNKETVDACVACTTHRAKPLAAAAPAAHNLPIQNTFGDAYKPRSDTWECDACMVRNNKDASQCVACNTKKSGVFPVNATIPKLQTDDVGFKSLVAQQTASKWECDACMTRNDAERSKCVCCEQAKPGTQVVSDEVPKFCFGTSSASKFTFGFAGAKKEEELKAEAATKTETNKSFTFGIPPKTDVGTNNSTVSSTGITFGVPAVTKSTSPTGEEVADIVKSNTSGFKFGFQPADSSKVEANAAPAGLIFGIKADAKPASRVQFNLPPTAAETNKSVTTSTSAITSTSSTSAAAPPLFNPIASSAFGAPQKVETTKSDAVTNKPGTGFAFGSLTSTTLQSAAVKPIIGNTCKSEANKSPPKITCEAPTTTFATGTVVSTSSPASSGFVFGKPATATAAFSTTPSGFGFGKEQLKSGAADAPSPFGSPASSSNAAVSKNVSPGFGSLAATSTAVSSSTAGFVFGKSTTTTPMFGASSSTASTSVFGSKPSSLFVASSSTPSSTIPLTPATNTAATFVFGGGVALNAPQNNNPLFGSGPFESGSTVAAAASTTAASSASSWPTNTFTFGSSKCPEEVKSNSTPAPTFGAPSSIFGQASIFGSAQVGEVKPTPVTASAAPSFGAPSATTSLFGSNMTSSPAGSVQQNNVFGSTSSTAIFGSTSFGAVPAAAATPAAPVNSNSLPGVAPTFGSSSSFSSVFGSIAAAPSSSSGNDDGASAPKKADLSFNFGSAQNSGNGGFPFGSNNNNKPAADSVFKFSTSSTPRFNFTGSSESPNATQPFQFGAPTSTPAVFNFGGVESNANIRITDIQSASSSKNACNKSPDNTAVDHSVSSRQWLRPIRDDRNIKTNTYINANAISSSSSNKSSSQQAPTIAAYYKQQTNQELSTFPSSKAPLPALPEQKQQQQTPPPTPLQQQKSYHTKSFLMQKFKFYRTSKGQQCLSNSSSGNRCGQVSDANGNGGDDDHHDSKDDTKNNDKLSSPDDRDQHDKIEYLMTDNVKTGDESTKANSSNHSTNINFNINPDQQHQQQQKQQQHCKKQFNHKNHGQLYQPVRQTRSLSYQKFASTTSKYTLIRKRATSTTISSTNTTAGATTPASAKILRVPPKRFCNASTLAVKRTGNRASYLANTTTSTTKTAAKIPYQATTKYKFVKKSKGN